MRKLIALSALVFLTNCGPVEVWMKRYEGEGKLVEAESSKKVQVEDARGKLEAAKLLAAAEVERAKGVAVANSIIGESLKNNEAYLRYLWIHNLETGGGERIYIATEAGLPILEARSKK